MQYKILKVVVPAETSSSVAVKTEEAIEQLETEVQSFINNGWDTESGAQIAATKLGHIMLIQTITKV